MEKPPPNPTSPPSGVRLDKWLWAARVYRTRSLAIAACQAGHVKISGQRVKPSRLIRPGEVLTARAGEANRVLKVVGLPGQRVGARRLPEVLEDLTPAEEYRRRRQPQLEPLFHRPKGTGRPTKRSRRLMEQLGWREQDG